MIIGGFFTSNEFSEDSTVLLAPNILKMGRGMIAFTVFIVVKRPWHQSTLTLYLVLAILHCVCIAFYL